MRQALFDRLSGHYVKNNPIGKKGDFITAPEISQTFGELIAAYILQLSANIKKDIVLTEMGAGQGTLFFDILTTIDKLAKNNNALALDFLGHARFCIIEISPALTKIQQEKLKDFKIEWLSYFDKLNMTTSEELIFISNELFDCFAIDQYVKTDIGWCERVVEKLQFVTANFDPKINQFVEEKVGKKESDILPFGAVFEYSKEAADFMAQLCRLLSQKGGIAIIIDYGYIKNEFANTLQALKNHQKINVLEGKGSADITALVDFLMLEKIAKEFSLDSSLVTQREFLLGLGIEERRKALTIGKTKVEIDLIKSEIDRLIDKNQMGELFKCLIIWR